MASLIPVLPILIITSPSQVIGDAEIGQGNFQLISGVFILRWVGSSPSDEAHASDASRLSVSRVRSFRNY